MGDKEYDRNIHKRMWTMCISLWYKTSTVKSVRPILCKLKLQKFKQD